MTSFVSLQTLNFHICISIHYFLAYFLEKCYQDDEEINECLKYSGNKLIQHLRQDGGIPELGIEEIEPVVIDEISIALGECNIKCFVCLFVS